MIEKDGLKKAKLDAKIIKKNCVMDGWMELIWLLSTP